VTSNFLFLRKNTRAPRHDAYSELGERESEREQATYVERASESGERGIRRTWVAMEREAERKQRLQDAAETKRSLHEKRTRYVDMHRG
jgi:hypothetical protein